MSTPTKQRTTLTRLLAELRELPDGLATPVRADLLIADVLGSLGYGGAAVSELVGVDVDRAGSGVLEVVGA